MASNTPIKSLGLALQQTLSPNPAERRQAERALDDFKRQPGFSQLALQLAQSDTYDDGTPAPQPIRQAAALLFKNYIRYGWALVCSFSTSSCTRLFCMFSNEQVQSGTLCRSEADKQK